MILTYFIVGCMFALPELIIVTASERFRLFVQRHQIAELIFSLSIGVLVGLFSGLAGNVIAGTTFLIGNVMGTVITKVVYSLHLIEFFRWLKGHAIAFAQSCVAFYRSVESLVRTIVYIISIPFRIIAAVLRILNRVSEHFRAHSVSNATNG